ncbi:MAG: isoprenylcysteine carboxylmethyltransferase family protein [Geobacter sp.]|nr:isoprenylcysteine carboxylmethyltransferase family protein [Geobacter sp.]
MSAPWWKNSRGELFVATQFIVFALVAFGPRTLSIFPGWPDGARIVGVYAGGLLLCSGVALATAGTFGLGRNLTPLIIPKSGAVLLETGAYSLVRHPIYSGLLQMAFGWGLWVHGWLTLGYGLVLLVIFDLKSRREEKFLQQIFPGYGAYSSRVKRLIPFIY